MTSPVDTTVTYTHSQMSGAPILVAQPGSLVALIDAVLVNGFDSKPATSIVIASGIATLTFVAPHSAEQESVIQVSGATAPFTDINGRQKVVAKTSTTVTFRTALPDGNVPGTLAFMMASAGWAKVFTATNVGVYRSTDPMSNGHFFRIDDNDPITARVRGYESMSDVNTGVNPFPTDTQLSGLNAASPTTGGAIGGYWYKGFNASTFPVGWTFFADNRFFMYGSQNYQSQGTSYPTYNLTNFKGFGDPICFRVSGDPYSTLISIGNVSTQSQNQGGSFSQGDNSYGTVVAARPYTGVGAPQYTSVCSYSFPSQSNENLSGATANSLGKFPSVIDGSLRFSQKFIKSYTPDSDADHAPRGNIPGILSIPMTGVYSGLPPKTIIPGTGIFASRKLVSAGIGSYTTDSNTSPNSSGICLFDITGPWR